MGHQAGGQQHKTFIPTTHSLPPSHKKQNVLPSEESKIHISRPVNCQACGYKMHLCMFFIVGILSERVSGERSMLAPQAQDIVSPASGQTPDKSPASLKTQTLTINLSKQIISVYRGWKDYSTFIGEQTFTINNQQAKTLNFFLCTQINIQVLSEAESLECTKHHFVDDTSQICQSNKNF